MGEHEMVGARRRADGRLEQVLPDGSTRILVGRTDWARLEAMTEEEIEANALSDRDNPPLTPAELRRMRPVPNPKEIRRRLGITQEQFAARFGLPLGTLRDWKQGAREPDSAARTLLRVIEREPEAEVRALEG